eukprot:4740727-Pyramimonas_sp.AAC.1
MVNAGNRVVFDKDPNGKSLSHIMNKATGKLTAIHEKNGTFQFNITVPKGPEEAVNTRSEVNMTE